MIQLIIIGIFVLLVAYDSDACNELNIICKTTCKLDGDDKGIVIDNKCYCANYKDLNHIAIKVPKNGGLVAEKKKYHTYD